MFELLLLKQQEQEQQENKHLYTYCTQGTKQLKKIRNCEDLYTKQSHKMKNKKVRHDTVYIKGIGFYQKLKNELLIFFW